MKKRNLAITLISLALLAVLSAGSAAAAPGDIEWVRQFGMNPQGAGGDIITITQGIAPAGDGSGKVYVAGFSCVSASSVSCLTGFVRQYDAGGNVAWSHTLYAQVYGVAANASGVYVTGLKYDSISGNTEPFLGKYDAGGNEVWTHPIQGTGAIAADASGVYVAGVTSGGNGDFDVFVRKYDADGAEIWTRQFGTSTWDYVVRMAADASGVYLAGYTYGAFPGQTNAGDADVFVRMYDAAGNDGWVRQFGTATRDSVSGIAADSSGVYVAGSILGALSGQTSAGDADAFVRKYDLAGDEIWTRQFGTTAGDSAGGISVDASGVYVAGVTSGAFSGQTSAGDLDVFVRRYDAGGFEGWTRQFGTSAYDELVGVAANAAGVYTAGHTRGVFSGQTRTGWRDAFVAKIQTNQQPVVEAGPDATIIQGQAFSGSGTFTDPDSNLWTAAVDYGDGSGAQPLTLNADKTFNLNHTYAAAGAYPVTVTVSDDGGGMGSDTLTLTVLTPREGIEGLIDQVHSLIAQGALSGGQGNALIVKLDGVIKQLEKGKTNPAINELRAFINQVNGFMNSTPPILMPSEGQPLIDAARAIIAALGG